MATSIHRSLRASTLAILVATALVAGCGSDDGDTSATAVADVATEPSDSSAPAVDNTVVEPVDTTSATDATDATDATEVEPAEFASEMPQGNNPVGAAAGKTVGFISACQNCEAMSRMTAAYEEAVAAAGMKLRVFDAKGDPAAAATGLETLLQAGVDIIVLGALPPQVLAGVIDQARAAGVPVYGSNTGVPSAASDGITAFNIEENLGEAQQALAARLVDDVGADAQILYMFDDILPVGQAYDAGLRSGLGNVTILESAQHDLTQITQQGFDTAQTWFTKHPDADAVLCAYDAGCLGVYQAAQAAGIDIPIYSGNGNLENTNLIREGAPYVTNALAIEYGAWLGLDTAIALLNGEPVSDPPAVRDLIIDASNVPAEGVYDGSMMYGDFRAHFTTRWGVG